MAHGFHNNRCRVIIGGPRKERGNMGRVAISNGTVTKAVIPYLRNGRRIIIRVWLVGSGVVVGGVLYFITTLTTAALVAAADADYGFTPSRRSNSAMTTDRFCPRSATTVRTGGVTGVTTIGTNGSDINVCCVNDNSAGSVVRLISCPSHHSAVVCDGAHRVGMGNGTSVGRIIHMSCCLLGNGSSLIGCIRRIRLGAGRWDAPDAGGN